jgi:hypothetical protein
VTEDEYQHLQEAWLKETKIQVGDKVMCISCAESYQGGWQGAWSPNMDAVEGTTGEVFDIESGSQGIGVNFPILNNIYKRPYFPFFALIKSDE